MARVYGFSSTPIDPTGPDGEASWAWKLRLASIPLEGYISDFNGFFGYARRDTRGVSGAAKAGARIRFSMDTRLPPRRRQARVQQVAHGCRTCNSTQATCLVRLRSRIQQVAHAVRQRPSARLLADAHAAVASLAGESPLAPAFPR